MQRMRLLYGSSYAPTFRGSVLLGMFDRSARSTRVLMPDQIYAWELSDRHREELAALYTAGLFPGLDWHTAGLFDTQVRAYVPGWTRYSPPALAQVAFQRAIAPGPLLPEWADAPYRQDALEALEAAHDAGVAELALAYGLAVKAGK